MGGADFDAAGRFNHCSPRFVEEGKAREGTHGRNCCEEGGGGILELGEGQLKLRRRGSARRRTSLIEGSLKTRSRIAEEMNGVWFPVP